MKASEIELMSNEMLANELTMCKVALSDEQWVRNQENVQWLMFEASKRLRTLTALEAKIKGMIDRPKVEVDSPRVSADGDMLTYPVLINGETVAIYYGAEFAEEHRSDLTKALGIEGGADE